MITPLKHKVDYNTHNNKNIYVNTFTTNKTNSRLFEYMHYSMHIICSDT